jgi:uncharacterized protein (TIGR04141 family)
MTETPKVPLRSLSLFLLAERIADWEEALRSTANLQRFELAAGSGIEGVVYLRSQGRNVPGWVDFVEPHVADEGALRRLFNASTSAVLFLLAAERRFAFVFGQGRHLLDPDSYEYDFGLRVVLNAVEPERLKSVDAKRFDERTMHTRRDSSREASFGEFGLDLRRDLLRQMVGRPRDPELAHELAGSDVLKVSTREPFPRLPRLAGRLLDTYEADDYKQNFAAIDQLRPLRSAADVERLDQRLLDDLRSRDLDHIHLAAPEITDWMDHDGFRLSTVRDGGPPEPDPSISRYLDSLRDVQRLDIAKLKRDYVEAVDAATGIARRRWPVYACLVYDARLDDGLAVLSGRQWFRVSRDFDQEVTAFVEGLPDTDLTLPAIPRGMSEHDYNPLAAAALGATSTHGDLVRVAGRDPVELADILTAARQFLHLKRRGASSTLSHLFAQGLISAELYLDDQAYRDAAADLLGRLDADPDLLSAERPDPAEWEVAYVILSRGRPRKDSPYTLPFFSLANLAGSAKRLQDRGFKVSVCLVPEVAAK